MNLSEYAKIHGIKYRAAWNRFKQGKIHGAYQDEFGKIIVPEPTNENKHKAVIYARVSSTQQKESLEKQAKRLEEYAITQGYTIIEIIKETASGVNDNRPKLTKLLQRNDWGTIIVEHKDRLTRIGYNWFEILLQEQGKTINVANQATEKTEDILDDFRAIMYSFLARAYGQRSAKAKKKAIEEVLDDN